MFKRRNLFGDLVTVYGLYGLDLPENIGVDEASARIPNLVTPIGTDKLVLRFHQEVEDPEDPEKEPISWVRVDLRTEDKDEDEETLLVGTILSCEPYFAENPSHLLFPPDHIPGQEYMSGTYLIAYMHTTGGDTISLITNYLNRNRTTIRVYTDDELFVEINNHNGTVDIDVPVNGNEYSVNTWLDRASKCNVTVVTADACTKSRFEYRNVEDVDDEH